MNLAEFRQALADHPEHGIRIEIDGEHAIADHFHVTEVGRVEKHFVDCGGVRRSSVACAVQTLVASDIDHRLTTTKLAKIMQLADSLALPPDAPVEIEHQERSVSVDSMDGFEAADGVLVFRLAAKQTACLAEDACGIAGLDEGGPNAIGLNVISDCCDRPGSC